MTIALTTPARTPAALPGRLPRWQPPTGSTGTTLAFAPAGVGLGIGAAAVAARVAGVLAAAVKGMQAMHGMPQAAGAAGRTAVRQQALQQVTEIFRQHRAPPGLAAALHRLTARVLDAATQGRQALYALVQSFTSAPGPDGSPQPQPLPRQGAKTATMPRPTLGHGGGPPVPPGRGGRGGGGGGGDGPNGWPEDYIFPLGYFVHMVNLAFEATPNQVPGEHGP